MGTFKLNIKNPGGTNARLDIDGALWLEHEISNLDKVVSTFAGLLIVLFMITYTFSWQIGRTEILVALFFAFTSIKIRTKIGV